MFARRQCLQPFTKPVISTFGVSYHRPCTMYQQLSQITVATFGDAKSAVFSARAVLAWRESDRGCKITSFGEGPAITQGSG